MFFGYVLRRGELLWNKATVFYLEELQLNQRFVRIMGPFKKDIGVFFFELFLRDLEGTEPAMADVFIYIYIYLFFVVLHQSSMQCHNANLRNSRESAIFLQLFPY